MLSVQHGRANPYVRGPVLLLCLPACTVECQALHQYLIRGRTAVQRRTACLQRHRLSHSRPRTNQGMLATCRMTQSLALRLGRKIQIWMLSYFLSVKFYGQTEGRKTQVVFAVGVLESHRHVLRRGKWGAAQGKWPAFELFGLHKYPMKPSSTRAGSPDLFSCFEPSAWRLRSAALMAGCVMEIGLCVSPAVAPHFDRLSFLRQNHF